MCAPWSAHLGLTGQAGALLTLPPPWSLSLSLCLSVSPICRITDINELLKDLDANGDGRLDAREFASHVTRDVARAERAREEREARRLAGRFK